MIALGIGPLEILVMLVVALGFPALIFWLGHKSGYSAGLAAGRGEALSKLENSNKDTRVAP